MDNSLFFKSNISNVKEEFEVDGIEKFKFPVGHEKEGDNVPWIIKKLTTKRTEELAELCKTKKIIKGRKVTDINEKKYNDILMAESIVFPDLKDKELQEQYGVRTNVDLMRKLLEIAADYAKINQSFNRINGFDESEEEIIDEAKN